MNTPNKAADILLRKFEESRQRNPSWSQRAFAKQLGVSSGALSEILKGKRAFSSSIKKKMASRLQLSPQEQSDFFEGDLPSHMVQTKLEYMKLSNDQFHLISDWWHYAILNLVKTKDFKPYPTWIADRLGISCNTAQEAWDRLLRLGHLEKNKNQKVVRKYPRTETSEDLFDLSIRRSHLEDLKLMEKSILEHSIPLRDHSSMTLVLNKKDISKAKELIRIFQDRFSDQLEKDVGEDVYRLSISLFPLTKPTQTP